MFQTPCRGEIKLMQVWRTGVWSCAKHRTDRQTNRLPFHILEGEPADQQVGSSWAMLRAEGVVCDVGLGYDARLFMHSSHQ
jgi:hypothetical protein